LFTKEIGSLLGDDVKFKRIDQMRRIQADLMQFSPIDELARQTCAQFITELLAQDIATKMADEPNSFYDLLGEPSSVKFGAGQCAVADEREVELSGGVVVREYNTDTQQLVRALRCKKASLLVEGDELAPTLTMNIDNAREEGTGNLRMWYVIRGLIPPAAVTGVFKTGNILQDIRFQAQSSALRKGPSPKLKELNVKLQRRIQKTLVEIKAELHSRLAFGMGCVPMILIGIALGVVKRGGHMLSAFAASCVPAAVLIVCIISGKHLTESLGAEAISGMLLMWAGLGVLTLLVVVIYHRLLRN